MDGRARACWLQQGSGPLSISARLSGVTLASTQDELRLHLLVGHLLTLVATQALPDGLPSLSSLPSPAGAAPPPANRASSAAETGGAAAPPLPARAASTAAAAAAAPAACAATATPGLGAGAGAAASGTAQVEAERQVARATQLVELVAFLRRRRLLPRWMAHVLTRQPQWFDMAFRKEFAEVRFPSRCVCAFHPVRRGVAVARRGM